MLRPHTVPDSGVPTKIKCVGVPNTEPVWVMVIWRQLCFE